MSLSCRNEKCICTKGFLSERQLRLTCTQCSSLLHLKRTGLTKQNYTAYKKGKKDYVCLFCLDYKCIICDRYVYDRQGGVFCDGCQLWIHRKCANLTKTEYVDLKTHKMKTPGTVKIAKEIISHSMIFRILKLEHYLKLTKKNTKETVYQIVTLKLKNSHAMSVKKKQQKK